MLEEGMTELLTSQLGTVTHMPPELIQLEDGARCADFGGGDGR